MPSRFNRRWGRTVVPAPSAGTSTAIKDRAVRTKGSTPTLGVAGTGITDANFGSRISRVTDANTVAASVGAAYTMGGSSWTLSWNADSTKFFGQGRGGQFMLFDWNPVTRIGTFNRNLPFNFGAVFDPTNPNLIYGYWTGNANGNTIVKVDYSTTPSTITALTSGLAQVPTIPNPSYGNSIQIGGTKLMFTCGGVSQDFNTHIIYYPLDNPGAAQIFANYARTGYYSHSAHIDKSGAHVFFFPSSLSGAPYQVYRWTPALDTVVAMSDTGGGHTSFGYNAIINADAFSTWDSAQWIYRTCTDMATKRELVSPVLSPQEIYLGEHTSWNSASASSLVPVVSGTYRIYNGPQHVAPGPVNTTEWRPWDEELISIQTDGAASTVWRHCHHRSLTYPDGTNVNGYQFEFTPRPNVSPDGNWIAFSSNWDKTLGTDTTTGMSRTDIFVVERFLG